MRTIFFGLFCCAAGVWGATVMVEAESFTNLGGWVVDQQSMDQMGSPYLMAHGLGVPVADATTQITIPQSGKYRLFVRTRDWVAGWGVSGAPGSFKITVNSNELPTTYGNQKAEWHWQKGDIVDLPAGDVTLGLRDLTGFNGRCDAIILTTDQGLNPPDSGYQLEQLRRDLLKVAETPSDGGTYDLVVVGGGMAGCCTAVSAARLGCRVVLIQDRPVLGGNNSSEVRVGLSGLIHQQPYPRLGDLVDEIGSEGHWTLHQAQRSPDLPRSREVLEIIKQHPEKKIHNAGPATNYGDERKQRVISEENNLELVLSTRVVRVERQGAKIVSVVGKDIRSGVEKRFKAPIFVDCTGDGGVGYLAGADFRNWRESQAESAEELAPEKADKLLMGVSVQWYAEPADKPAPFPETPWALPFTEETAKVIKRGDWNWEAGITQDSVDEIESIRDYALRAVFGNWSYLKNHSSKKDRFANEKLAWVAYIGGKRESRRLLGDLILTQQDLEAPRIFPDACVTTTWPLDLHYPDPENHKHFPEGAFLAVGKAKGLKTPYPIPYRCLYSRNIENLFMAGRNISVTHIVLGSTRVMRTAGMMGEVVGMAAALCHKHQCLPRDVYNTHLDELKTAMQQGVGKD